MSGVGLGTIKANSITISNTTDATSSASGGTFTTAGGLAIGKKLFVGTNLDIGTTGLTTFNNPDANTGAGPPVSITVSGGIYISNSTDATSSNGGALQTVGGITVGASIRNTSTTPALSSSGGAITTFGGLSINNTTDASSSTNGGTITTAGGLAVAKSAYIGTDLSVSGTTTIADLESSNFTITWDGFTASTTSDAYVDKVGQLVTLSIKGSQGTSNTTAMGDLAIIPASFRPSSLVQAVVIVQDSGSYNEGTITVNSSGDIIMYTTTLGTFTASGTKGFGVTNTWTTITYTLRA